MKFYNNRSGRQLPRRRVICCTPKSSSLGMLADLLSQRSALLDYIRKNDGQQDAKMGEIASMKFELQHVQAQIDAMNSGEFPPSQLSTVDSKLEASVGQVARQAISAQDQEGVTLTCGQASSGTVSGCWAVVVAPYIAEGKKKLQMSFAFTVPDTAGLSKPADVALVWGLAHDGNSPWHEPPPGWSTEPPVSWDIAHGAWGTRSAVLGEVPVTGTTSAPVYGVLIDVPWKSSMRRYSAIAFKWTVKAGKDKLWFGDESGGNLSVRTSFAKLVLSDGQSTTETSDSDDSPPHRDTSDKEDPSDLLTGLSQGQITALRATRSEGPHPAPDACASSIEGAVDPWMQAASSSGREQHVAHDCIHGMGSDEHNACRSLMHRYDIAHKYVQRIDWPKGPAVEQAVREVALSHLTRGPSAAATHTPLQGVLQHAATAESQLMAVAVWLRLAAARLLVWNHNYNVKPREISTSQQNVTSAVADTWRTCPWARKTAVMVLATVGRGGDGNQGQRIRDEILSIQSRNGCKGGMMEQWHQKLHNNTSPDDVEICRALIAYLQSGLDIKEYWSTLHAAGIDEQRLASFDRSITQEPFFSKQQVPQLLKDLQAYLVTLCAVHGGLDLQSAALPVLGYSQVKRKGRSVHVDPVDGFNTERLRVLVQSLLALQQCTDSSKDAVTAAVNDVPRAKLQLAVQKMELCMEARNLCSDYLTADAEQRERARDVLHLDIVLTGTVRTIIEANLDYWLALLKDISSAKGLVASGDALLLLQMCNYATANYAQLQPDNEHAVACTRELQQASALLQATRDVPQKLITWKLQVLLAIAQRLGRVITHDSSRTLEQMEATCRPLASALNVDQGAAQVAIEDAVRAMPHAPLAQLLSPLELTLQKMLDGSMWRIVSPMQSGAVTGRLRFERSLAAVQDLELEEPTIIIAEQVGGDEDLPKGAVGLLCMQNIDVLCHAALRARATGAFLACCLDKDILSDLNSKFCGQQVCLTMNGQDVAMSKADDGFDYSNPMASAPVPAGEAQELTIPPLDCSEWVVRQGVDEQHVGSKCVNLWRLSDEMRSLVPVPAAVALPYSAWPRLLSLPENHNLATALSRDNMGGTDVEESVLKVSTPEDLVKACSDAVDKLTDEQVSGSDDVMHAIKRVWASKYGERARRACSFLNVPLSSIHMSVVLQPLINASMAFVSHTQDPRQLQGATGTGQGVQQMYIEAVVGLGESLVGNVDGQPLSCTVDSQALLQSLQDAVRSGRVEGANLRCLGESVGKDSTRNSEANMDEWLSKLPKSDFEAAASSVRVLTASSKAWMVVPGMCAADSQRSSPDLHYGIIARSASNMEDLQSYSGAGVFDSFPTAGSVHCVAESLGSWQGGFAELEHRLLAMALASLEVKACLNEGEMDVEGLIDAFGKVHVVQARPQV